MGNRVNRARFPEQNSADGLLPVEKNSFQLKIYSRIGEFTHGEKRQLMIHIIFYQRSRWTASAKKGNTSLLGSGKVIDL